MEMKSTEQSTPTQRQAPQHSMSHDVRPFIGGEFVDPRTNEYFDNIDPSNGTSSGVVPDCDEGDVNRAVHSARRAFEKGDWSRLSPQLRKEILQSLCDEMHRCRDELAELDSLDMGMPIAQSRDSVETAIAYLYFNSELLDKITADVQMSDQSSHNFSLRAPRGVVGAIVPWNFPVFNAIIKAAPCLGTGNSLILKPSEISPRSAQRLAELAIAAGLPSGVFNVVPGSGVKTGQALGCHPDVDMITFTGSSATGGLLLQYAGASNLKNVILECGGKCPMIVFPDVEDLDAEAERIANRASWNQGQVCLAVSRLIVHRSIADALLDKVVERLSKVKPGYPLDETTTHGPVASSAQLEKILSHMAADEASSSTTALKGQQVMESTGGFYVTPSVFADVDPKSELAQQEIFGPVLTAFTFGTIEEAITLANNSKYGLFAYVSTRDSKTSHVMANELRVGAVQIDASPRDSSHDNFCSSIEPCGISGFGIEEGMDGMLSYTQLRSVRMNYS
jgi:acyl-CoA reductase-like NAD-dependent aldehyde dehydrogenase